MAVESPPTFLQAGTYGAEQTRRAIGMLLQRGGSIGSVVGGIITATDCQLAAPGSGMSVNVTPGEVVVPGSSAATQSGYGCRVSSTTNLAIAASDPTNPRIDRVSAIVTDAAYAGGTNTFAVAVQTGTPTTGATLSNLSGAAAAPVSSMTLGYVLVPATATNIITADIKNVAPVLNLGSGMNQPGAFTSPARSIGTTYQPNTLRPTMVLASIGLGTTSGQFAEAGILIDPFTPPTGTISVVDLSNGAAGSTNATIPVTFVVPAGWYYQIQNMSSTGTVTLWSGVVIELTL